jgi:hypothetical protein
MSRKPADWMVPLDERILEILRAEGWSAPAYIARKVSLWASVGRVDERCRMLTDARMIEPLTPEFENYDITGVGHRYLDGQLDASTQPRPQPSGAFQG